MTQGAPGEWVVFKPDGGALDTSGSRCQGLTEAIAFALANGHDLEIEGGGLVGTRDPSVIRCEEPIVFPPMQKFALRTGSITLNFAVSVMCRPPWCVAGLTTARDSGRERRR